MSTPPAPPTRPNPPTRSTNSTRGCCCCSPTSPGWVCWSARAGSASRAAPSRPGWTNWSGVASLGGFPPELDLAAMGYGLTAFAVLEIAQGRRAEVIAGLAAIAEVCEVHATTGQGDLLVRMVARSNADLQRVIDEVVDVPGVQRLVPSIALSTPVPPRVRPLLDRLIEQAPGGQPGAC